MPLLESGNPVLSEKNFGRTISIPTDGTMTVRGAINKFGFLMIMVIAGAVFTWHLYSSQKDQTMMTWMFVGLIGGLITGLIISFRPQAARWLAPLYGLLEGLFIGAISAVVNEAFKVKYPGIVVQAVGLTMGVAVVMFLLYSFRIIKATEKFKAVVFGATAGIMLFYLVCMVLGMFHVSLPFTWNASPLGIGISLFVVAIAALNLILDFDLIEQGAKRGAPKFMEWYGAFGLLVTLVWLYFEILKLLTRIASSRN